MNKDKLIFIENGDLRKVLLVMGLPMTARMIASAYAYYPRYRSDVQ